ncbi:MAG: class I SAM-dependent methyltransferase [Gammaproteobacteria bacterium]|nr:class I SAM-dependent methyltransferase [Gammaproteobacteria bacterium]
MTDLQNIEEESVDIVLAEGTLHHTDSTEDSINYLVKKLKKGGRFLFYVYVKKAILREFSDDHIRNHIATLSDDEAWEALKPLTKLGKALGELKVNIEVPEDIPYLGIKKGKQDIQRFVYWNICKLFHRDEFSLDEMNHINFDWYRPLNCHRHTEEEIRYFCKNAGLGIERIKVEEAGITVVAKKE